MKVAILAGGLGTRLREETDLLPKPMVQIGGKPIIWHIMKTYAQANLKDFVVCAGYKGNVIKEYFREFQSLNSDFTVTLGSKTNIEYHDNFEEEKWRVTVAETGLDTMTGGRLFKARKHLSGGTFMCTYGDGVANIDIKKLLDFHRSHGKIATISTVRPETRFGVLDINSDNSVKSFREKPQSDNWVNAGYFVFEEKIFDYLTERSVLENEPFAQLAKDNQMQAFRHEGFWQPMDTYREFKLLNDLWDSNKAPWRVWK
jgi:glucose-1-phosphate cytidylyltransferase